jgi:outer membrane protein TolC
LYAAPPARGAEVLMRSIPLFVTLLAVAAQAREVTLADAVAAARARSPAVGVEVARLGEAEADATTASAGLWPRLSASASYVQLNSDRLSPLGGMTLPGGATPTLYTTESFVGARAKQVLFDGVRSWKSRAAGQHGVAAERAAVAGAQADAVLGATVAFTRLLAAQQLRDVALASLERQQVFAELTRARASAGKSSELDAMKAAAQRLDAERVLVAAREAEASAAAELARATGDEDETPLVAVGGLGDEGEPPVPAPGAIVAAALARDPDVARVRALLAQAEASVWASRGGYLPELSVQGTYGYRQRDVGGGAAEWTAGVYADWLLFEGFGNTAAVDKAEARARGLRETERSLRLQLGAEATQAVAAWRGAVAAIAATAEGVRVAREALTAADALYQLGRATGLDVLTAQSEIVRAEASLVQARADLVVARARVARLAVE